MVPDLGTASWGKEANQISDLVPKQIPLKGSSLEQGDPCRAQPRGEGSHPLTRSPLYLGGGEGEWIPNAGTGRLGQSCGINPESLEWAKTPAYRSLQTLAQGEGGG